MPAPYYICLPSLKRGKLLGYAASHNPGFSSFNDDKPEL